MDDPLDFITEGGKNMKTIFKHKPKLRFQAFLQYTFHGLMLQWHLCVLNYTAAVSCKRVLKEDAEGISILLTVVLDQNLNRINIS